jgi:hypothetical protein
MSEPAPVAVLFARANSIYKTIPGCDVWDKERDARNWPGGCPVVAHPPCRAWSRLRHFAKPEPGEKDLGVWAAGQVRRYGGVLEHPARSLLWLAAGLPRPGRRDRFGGWTLAAPQVWWGHRAEKATWFYIVGVEPSNTPPIPFTLKEATHTVSSGRFVNGVKFRPELSKKGRESTPPALATWLVELARRCKRLDEVAV